jgi:hypothetical protein
MEEDCRCATDRSCAPSRPRWRPQAAGRRSPVGRVELKLDSLQSVSTIVFVQGRPAQLFAPRAPRQCTEHSLLFSARPPLGFAASCAVVFAPPQPTTRRQPVQSTYLINDAVRPHGRSFTLCTKDALTMARWHLAGRRRGGGTSPTLAHRPQNIIASGHWRKVATAQKLHPPAGRNVGSGDNCKSGERPPVRT